MDLIPVLFIFFAAIIIISALIVVFSKNIIYSAFSLLFTFFGVAAFYVMLNADFVAITQIMIYIGGILVLIIFGVMLTNKITGVDIKTGTTGRIQKWLSFLIGVLIITVFYFIFLKTYSGVMLVYTSKPTINSIGKTLMTDYLLAFEASSVLLLIAIIGAALIARRKK
jgi:NADH-quinone oxidoreductase subunit J